MLGIWYSILKSYHRQKRSDFKANSTVKRLLSKGGLAHQSKNAFAKIELVKYSQTY